MPQDPRSNLTATVWAGHASLLLKLGGVAEHLVKPHRLFGEVARQGGIDLITLVKLSRRHFILAAGFEQRVYLAQALPPARSRCTRLSSARISSTGFDR